VAILNQTGRLAARGLDRCRPRIPAGFPGAVFRLAAAALARSAALVPILACALSAASFAQVEEYPVKAAFLYNFAKFVDWPAPAFQGPGDPICICVLGQNPFGNSLERVVRGQVVDGRSIRIRLVPEVSPKTTCHILFVSAAERKRFQSAAASLRGVPTLTVGESRGFAADGGIVNFKLVDGKVRFEVNLDAAERAQIHISSKLLSLAVLVFRTSGTR
jgi:hypothetical protein